MLVPAMAGPERHLHDPLFLRRPALSSLNRLSRVIDVGRQTFSMIYTRDARRARRGSTISVYDATVWDKAVSSGLASALLLWRRSSQSSDLPIKMISFLKIATFFSHSNTNGLPTPHTERSPTTDKRPATTRLDGCRPDSSAISVNRARAIASGSAISATTETGGFATHASTKAAAALMHYSRSGTWPTLAGPTQPLVPPHQAMAIASRFCPFQLNVTSVRTRSQPLSPGSTAWSAIAATTTCAKTATSSWWPLRRSARRTGTTAGAAV